mgnify:CR=1 FL=1
MEVTFLKHEVLVKDKWVGKAGGSGSSERYDTRNRTKISVGGPAFVEIERVIWEGRNERHCPTR